MNSRRAHPILVQLLIPLAVYALGVIPAAILHREQINPDAVVYIRKALYLTRGDFAHSISGYWSPLLSWLIAPLLLLKLDGLHAARVIMALSGAALICAFYFFLCTFPAISKRWRFGATLLIALVAVHLATTIISPDLLMAACLFAYFAVVANDKWLQQPRTALLGGLLAGLAYLARAYALPFFLLHLLITIVLRLLGREKDSPLTPGRIVGRALLVVVGAGIFAGPWIATLSHQYGRFTFSTAPARAHALLHPQDLTRTAPWHFGRPDEPFISLSETPDQPMRLYSDQRELPPYLFWSPLDSPQFRAHQCQVLKENLLVMAQASYTFDRIPILPYLGEHASATGSKLQMWNVHFGLGAFLLSPLLICFVMPGQRWRTAWLLLTALAWCGGLLFIYCDSHDLVPLLLPLSLVLALQMVLSFRRQPHATPGLWRHLAALIVITSFFITAIGALWGSRGALRWFHPPADYRGIAQRLKKFDSSGPLASSDWPQGLYVAYFMERPFLGFPQNVSRKEAQALLDGFGAKILLCWPEPAPPDGPYLNISDAVKSQQVALNQRTFKQARRISSASYWTWWGQKDPQVWLQVVKPPPRPRKASATVPATSPATRPANKAPLRIFVRAAIVPEMTTTAPATSRDLVKIEKVPFLQQRPDFCGEACAAMWLNHLGAPWTQEQVFEYCAIDPQLGRGAYSEELGPALKKLGFDVGKVWYPVRKDNAADVEAQWQAVLDDLKKGIPNIVVMQFSEEDDDAHMRLVLGYDPAADEVIFHDPAEKDGAYQRMKRELFLKLWPLDEEEKGQKVWMVERIRLEGKKPSIAPPEKTPNAEKAQQLIKDQ